MPQIEIAAFNTALDFNSAKFGNITSGLACVFNENTFTTTEGVNVQASQWTPQAALQSCSFYAHTTWALNVTTGEITVGAFTIAGNNPLYATEDTNGVNVSTYSLILFTSNGQYISTEYEGIRVAATPTSTTWKNLFIASNAPHPLLPLNFVTDTMLEARLAELSLAGLAGVVPFYGSVALSKTPVNALSPITRAVNDNASSDFWDVRVDFGAIGDGVTNDTIAIQAAIDAATNSSKKRIYFPNTGSFYKCSGQLSVRAAIGITFCGDCTKVESTTDYVPSAIVYSGTGTYFIDASESRGFTLQGVGIQCSSASFTGDLISFTQKGAVGYGFTVDRCVFGGRTSAARFARSAVRLSDIVEAEIFNSMFTYCDQFIIPITASDSQFSTMVHIAGCRFVNYNNHAINTNNGKGWVIGPANVFEFKYNTAVAAGIRNNQIDGSGGQNTDGLIIIGNGFWDVTSGTWVDVAGYGLVFKDNYIELGAAGVALNISNTGIGCSLSGNRVKGSAGSKFLSATVTPTTYVSDDGTNILDAGVAYCNPLTDIQFAPRNFGRTGINTIKFTPITDLHVRTAAGNDALGGAITLDRNDSTNWRAVVLGSYFSNSLNREGMMVCISKSTTAPNDPSKFIVFITEDGDVINMNTAMEFKVGGVVGSTAQAIKIDNNATANNTRLLLWDVTAGALVRVSRGAADSGGTGFRVLRIPN